MITAWDVYWITRLDSISNLCIIITAIAMLSGGAAWFFGAMEDEDEWKKAGKRAVIFGFLPLLIATFVPSSREYAAMYLIPKMANSESAKNIADATDNATLLLKNKMAEWVKDTLTEKKK